MPDPVIEDRRERILLTGDLPSPANPPKGCRFHTRCPWRQETKCDTERPELRVVGIDGVPASHRVACHWAEQIASGELAMHEVKARARRVQHADRPGRRLHGPGHGHRGAAETAGPDPATTRYAACAAAHAAYLCGVAGGEVRLGFGDRRGLPCQSGRHEPTAD